MTSNNPLYAKLPPETLQIADRIGLATNAPDVTRGLLGSVRDIDKCLNSYYSVKQVEEKLHQSTSRSKRVGIKKDKKRLTSKERKELFKLKSKHIDFNLLLPLYDLWKKYMTNVLQSIKNANDLMKLIKCDYHGALVSVVAAKNTSLVGLTGIILQETKLTFKLVSENNRVSVIPKSGCIFAFESPVDGHLYKIAGSHIALSPVLRTRAKLKCRNKKTECNI